MEEQAAEVAGQETGMNQASEEEVEASLVTIDPMDCSLNFLLADDQCTGRSMTEGGVQYMWSGARATLGINEGKYYFKCQVLREMLPKDQQIGSIAPGEVDANCRCRIGVSTKACEVFFLGENANSWGYDMQGKAMHGPRVTNYGEKFVVRDELTCLVDLSSSPPTIGFARNKKHLGVAFHLDAKSAKGAFFPHVLAKNMEVRMDFGGDIIESTEESQESYLKGYLPWKHALTNASSVSVANQKRIEFTDCEVLMVVGLPGSGKTTWATEYTKTNPDKRFIILGNTLVEEQMRIPKIRKKHGMGLQLGRLDNLVTEVFNELLQRAAKLPRNYILDQTNVYANARVRKLKPFVQAGFRRKAAVVVVPDEVLFHQQQKQHIEEGKFVPDQEIAEMKANFNPPLEGQWPNFDEVMYIARNPSECIKIIEEQRSSSRTWLMHNRKRSNKDMDGRPYSNMSVHDFPGIGSMAQLDALHSNSNRMAMNRRHIPHKAMVGDANPNLHSMHGPRMAPMEGMMGPSPRDREMLVHYNQNNSDYNRPLLPSAKYQGLNHDRPMSMAGPMLHQSRPRERSSAGSGKATGVNAIPVGPRKPHHLPVHPMGMERNEKMHDLSSEGVRHGLHRSSCGYDSVGMDETQGYGQRLGDVSGSDSNFSCMPGKYNIGGTTGGHRRSHDKRAHMQPPHHMRESEHIPFKKHRTKSFHHNVGRHPTRHSLTRGTSKQIQVPKQPSANVMNHLPLNQPPPPPRKLHRDSPLAGHTQSRSPFTVNGLTVIPPAQVANGDFQRLSSLRRDLVRDRPDMGRQSNHLLQMQGLSNGGEAYQMHDDALSNRDHYDLDASRARDPMSYDYAYYGKSGDQNMNKPVSGMASHVQMAPNSTSTPAVPFHGQAHPMSSVHVPQPMIGPSIQNPGVPPSYSPHQSGLSQDQYGQDVYKESGMTSWEKPPSTNLNPERSAMQYPYGHAFVQHDSGAIAGPASYSYKGGAKDMHPSAQSLAQQEQTGIFASGSVGQDHHQQCQGYAQQPTNSSVYHPESQPAQGSGTHGYANFSEGNYGSALAHNPHGKHSINGAVLAQGDNYIQDGFSQQHPYNYSAQGYGYSAAAETYPPVPSDGGVHSYSSNQYNQVPAGQLYGQAAHHGPEPTAVQLTYQSGQAVSHEHTAGGEHYVPYEYPGGTEGTGYGSYSAGQYSQEIHAHGGQMNWSPYQGYGGGAYGIPQSTQVQQHPGQGY